MVLPPTPRAPVTDALASVEAPAERVPLTTALARVEAPAVRLLVTTALASVEAPAERVPVMAALPPTVKLPEAEIAPEATERSPEEIVTAPPRFEVPETARA